jgi:hypothetical protein
MTEMTCLELSDAKHKTCQKDVNLKQRTRNQTGRGGLHVKETIPQTCTIF